MTDPTPPPSAARWLQATVARPRDDGWTAVTDAGVEIVVPGSVVRGFRSLRTGQRLRVHLPRPDAARADEATPLSLP